MFQRYEFEYHHDLTPPTKNGQEPPPCSACKGNDKPKFNNMIEINSLRAQLVKKIGDNKKNGQKYKKNVFVIHAPNHPAPEGLCIIDAFHTKALYQMIGEAKVDRLRQGVNFPAVQQTNDGDWMRITVRPKVNDPRKSYFDITPCSAPK
jgi:hypothetical protein